MMTLRRILVILLSIVATIIGAAALWLMPEKDRKEFWNGRV